MPSPYNPGSYNPVTKTYTSPSGEKQSRSGSNLPPGTQINFSSKGGGGSARQSKLNLEQQRQRQAQLKAQQEAQRQAELEAQRKAEEQRRQREAQQKQQQLLETKTKLQQQNAQTRTILSKDYKTGEKIQQTRTSKGGITIVETKNLDTGKVSIQKLAPSKAGGSVRSQGGVSYTEVQQPQSEFIIGGDTSPDISLSDTYTQQGLNQNLGTQISYGTFETNRPIYTSPYIEQRFEKTVRFEGSNQDIPSYNYFYVDPTVIGKQEERPATIKEINFFDAQQNVLTTENTSEKPYTKLSALVDSAKNIYSSTNLFLYSKVTEPVFSYAEDKGFTTEKISNILVATNPFTAPLILNKDTRDFSSGIYQGVIEDIRDKPLKQVALFGAGYGIGFGSSAIIKGATLIPKVGGVASVSAKTGLVGAGLYFTGSAVASTTSQIISAPTSREKGYIFGTTAKDFALIGIGANFGSRGFTQVEGLYKTRGRNFFDVPQGEFPTAPASQQLKMFQENYYKQLSEKAGAFHTTPNKFYGGGTITPMEGTSELPGLYASTKISTAFARITGSATNKFNVLNIKNAIKNFFTPPGSPGVAYLTPEGFRYSPAVKSGGGKFSYKFLKSSKSGYADVPLIKSEIEAIFRTDAGPYSFQSGSYYTKINKVRVPIDVFNYDAGALGEPTSILEGGTKLYGGSSSYSGAPTTSSVVSLSSIGYGGGTQESSKVSSISSITSPGYSLNSITKSSSTTPSYKISTPTYSGSSKKSKSSPVISSVVKSVVSKSSPKKSYSPSYSSMIKSLKSSSSNIYSSSYVPPVKRGGGIFSKARKSPKLSTPKYSVQIRRFGKFRTIGTTSDLKKAISIGSERVASTLGATFKLTGKGLPKSITGFRSKKEKGGIVFIEPRRKRLSRTGEKVEIAGYKKRKKRATKKRRNKK